MITYYRIIRIVTTVSTLLQASLIPLPLGQYTFLLPPQVLASDANVFPFGHWQEKKGASFMQISEHVFTAVSTHSFISGMKSQH